MEPDQLADWCEGSAGKRPSSMADVLVHLAPILPLLDVIPNATIFLKDAQARYVFANRTLVQRCGFADPAPLRGKTSADVFPSQFGSGYTDQDQRVLRKGVALSDQLELHLYGSRKPGWCLTHKRPIHDDRGRVIGLAGISLDLQSTHDTHPAYARLAQVDDYIRAHFNRTISMKELTQIAGISVAGLERYCKRVFHLTPRQMILKARLEHASRLLLSDIPITEIALRCGYTDHSAFTRQFRSMTGMTPSQFRRAATLSGR
ncbi:helix-turn-helix domain-containing protein [Pseudomonas sp. Marseille-QA0892]